MRGDGKLVVLVLEVKSKILILRQDLHHRRLHHHLGEHRLLPRRPTLPRGLQFLVARRQSTNAGTRQSGGRPPPQRRHILQKGTTLPERLEDLDRVSAPLLFNHKRIPTVPIRDPNIPAAS
jgi:hypothetical protein